MYILVTYDVSTVDEAGRRRLRLAAQACLDYGQRVQNSVFECKVDGAQLIRLRARLLEIVDVKVDSVRIYFLGSNWEKSFEHHGIKGGFHVDGPLIV